MSDWVAPDTPASPGAAPGAPPPVGPPPRATHAERPDVAGAPPPVPVPLRPLTVPDLLDGGLRAWKLAPATFAGIAATFVVPVQVAVGWAGRDRVDDVEIGQSFADALTATGPADLDTGFDTGSFVLAAAAQGVALAFVTAAVATVVTGWYLGRRTAYREAVAAALRRAWPLAAAWVLVHLVEGAFALALLVPALVPMAWYAVVSPVIAVEGVGPVRAMRRSGALCRRRFWPVLGTCVLVAVTDALLTGALAAVGAIYLEADLPAGWAVNTAVAAAALLVTVPFVAAVATLLHLDLRVRTEGLDIELALRG